MKRLLSLAAATFAMVTFFSLNAFASVVPYNKFTGSTEFNADCQFPILVTPSTTMDLGAIAPGSTRDLLDAANYLTFTVSGGSGWKVEVSTTIDTRGKMTSGYPENNTNADVLLLGVSWFYSDATGSSASWKSIDLGTTGTVANVNFTKSYKLTNPLHDGSATVTDHLATGNKYFKVTIDQLQAGVNAAQGTYTFPVTLTATYKDMLLTGSSQVYETLD